MIATKILLIVLGTYMGGWGTRQLLKGILAGNPRKPKGDK